MNPAIFNINCPVKIIKYIVKRAHKKQAKISNKLLILTLPDNLYALCG